jgi:hypothetical protein
MNPSLVLRIVTFTLLACIAGCTSRNALTTKESQDCQAVVEGTFRSFPVFSPIETYPYLVLKKANGEFEHISGKILGIDSSGILFDQDKVSAFYDPEPKVYPYQEIQYAVDSTPRVIYGPTPQALEKVCDIRLVLIHAEDSSGQPLSFSIENGERFSFCVDSGTYFLKEIHFQSGSDIDSGAILPKMSFHAAGKSVNYIGNFLLDRDSSACAIPYKMEKRPARVLLPTLFGLTGSAIQALTTNYGVIGFHRFRIIRDDDYRTLIRFPLRYAPVTLEENPLITNIINKK